VVTDQCGNSSTAVAIINIHDTTAPTGSAPAGSFGNNVCASLAINTVHFNATTIALSYTDNCGGPVTAIPTDTLLIGDDCGWVLIYTFKVVDICGNAKLNQTITHTGSDLSAPTGTPPGTSLGNNACKANAVATYPFNPAVAGAGYTDNCSPTVTIQLTNTMVVGNDCAWAIIYTFSVLDPCNNALTGQQMIIQGSDLTPPTFTRPPDAVVYTNPDCSYNATPAVTGDVTNENDGCSSNLNATYSDNIAPGACSCTYVITRTWHLVDACGNAAPDQVQTITVVPKEVMNNSDSGPGSLREVIACAPDGTVITFSPTMNGQDIVLTSGEIVVNKNIRLSGVGLFDLDITGNNASRIFTLQPNKTFTIDNLSLKDATAATNGGAILTHGHLILDGVVLQHNFENGVPKAMTISPTGIFEAKGIVQIKY
jgi:hypothetical protein